MIGCFSAASNVTGILTDTNAVTASLHRHGALAFWDYATAGNYLWKMLCAINQWLLTNASWILQPRTSWLSWLVFWHLTYNIYIPYACWWQIPFSNGQNAHHYYRHWCMIRLKMIDNHISRQVFLYLVTNMGQRKNYCIPMRNPIADLGILPSNAHYWVIEPLWWVKAATDHFRRNEFRWHESSILTGSILFKG